MLAPGRADKYQPPELRVKLSALSGSVRVKGSLVEGRGMKGQGREREITVAWDGKRLTVDGRSASLPLRISGAGSIEVDGAGYRGGLLITASSPPLLLNLVDVESYLAGVINHEIDSRWPAAAVDAQAILARTYALKRREERKDQLYDLDCTTVDQVYGGMAGEDDRAWTSVNRTRARVLSYEGRLVAGLYHSACGGRTEIPSEVWGGVDQPYQKSAPCEYCQDAPRYFWRCPEEGALSGAELSSRLGLSGSVSGLKILERTGSGRVRLIEVSAGGKKLRLSGTDFRKQMGYDCIWSTAVQVEEEKAGFVFRGSGSGHGAGMCQWGARGMALKGFSSEQILSYYFPGTRMITWSPGRH